MAACATCKPADMVQHWGHPKSDFLKQPEMCRFSETKLGKDTFKGIKWSELNSLIFLFRHLTPLHPPNRPIRGFLADFMSNVSTRLWTLILRINYVNTVSQAKCYECWKCKNSSPAPEPCRRPWNKVQNKALQIYICSSIKNVQFIFRERKK